MFFWTAIAIAVTCIAFAWLRNARTKSRERYSREVSPPRLSETPKQTDRPKPTKPNRTTVKLKTKSNPDSHDILEQTFRFVAVDVETANADRSSICQLGIGMVTNEGHIHTLSFLIDPETEFEDFNVNLHGIGPSTVRGHPVFRDVLQAMRPFLERHTLIQHSTFDQQAINAACRRYGLPPLKTNWLNSVTIAQQAWPEFKGKGGHGLGHLKERLVLSFQHHDAAEDAKAAAMVVLLAEEKTGENFTELAKGAKRNSGQLKHQKSVAIEGRQGGALFGHVGCFTGQLSMSRTEAATIAAGAGITVKAGVSKKVTLLIVGDQDLTLLNGHDKSTKHRRAEELIAEGHEIRIISETEFLGLVREA